MTMARRSWALAAGAAALLSSQAVYAAPVRVAHPIDPLVSLSLLGTPQSRAAVCGTGVTCALPTTGTSPAVAELGASAAAVQYSADPYPPGRRVGATAAELAVLFFFPVVLFLVIALEDDNDDRSISPA